MCELIATAQSSADALPVTRVCHALGLRRATYDRWRPAAPLPGHLAPHGDGLGNEAVRQAGDLQAQFTQDARSNIQARH
jgi:hypothetical protein